jgi:hypothetical protein
MEENTKKLQEITQELQDNNEETVGATEKASLANVSALTEVRNNLSESFSQIRASFRDLGDAIVGNDLAKAEEAKEQKAVLQKIADKETEVNVNVDGGDKDDGSKIAGLSGTLGIAVASLAIIPGLAIGFVAGLKDSFKGLAKILKLDKVFGPMIAKIKLFFTNVGQRFANIGKALKNLFKPIVSGIKNAFAPLTKGTGKVLKPLKTLFKPILESFKAIGKTFNSIKGLFGAGGGGGGILGKIFSPIKNFVQTVMKAAPRFMKFGAAIGRLAGRLFLPFTIIMGIFDGVKGAIKGAEEQEGFFNKFIGGLGGAISGILKGLIGMPLDLLKNAIAWILGKFGMKDAEAALKGFSFTDLIGNIVKIPTDFLIGIVDNIKGIFQGDGSFLGNLYQSIGEIVTSLITFPITLLQKAVVGIGEFFGFDMSAVSDFDLAGKVKSLLMLPFNLIAGAFDFITNMFSAEGRAENMEKLKAGLGKVNDFLKKVVAFLLPKPDPSGAWYSPSNLASKAIPKFIYEYAGIDKETGAEIPDEGAMFTDAEGNLTDDSMKFDVSSLSSGAQEKIGELQNAMEDSLKEQMELEASLSGLGDSKGDRRKADKINRKIKALEEEYAEADRNIKIAVQQEFEGGPGGLVSPEEAALQSVPQDVSSSTMLDYKADAENVEPQEQFTPDLSVDAIAQSAPPAFKDSNEAAMMADFDVGNLEAQIKNQEQIKERLVILNNQREEAEIAADDSELDRLNKLIGRDEARLSVAEEKVANTSNIIGEGIEADAAYKLRVEELRGAEGLTVADRIQTADQPNNTIGKLDNTQGAQMEATISDTKDAEAASIVAVQGGNTNAPVTNNNNSNVTNVTYSESRHIEPTKDSYVFA